MLKDHTIREAVCEGIDQVEEEDVAIIYVLQRGGGSIIAGGI